MKAVIFAGGSGTRLWPVSRQYQPKQAQPFGDHETLLQKTYARLRRGFPTRDIWLSTSAEQYPLLKKQIPQLPARQVILEPARRDTAAAIGLAAAILEKKFPGQVMATVWSDAYIKETDQYLHSLKTAAAVVGQHPDQTVMLGLKPRSADTGLGYIALAKQAAPVHGSEVFGVRRFIEKPNQVTANSYLRSWKYLWNPGMFVFRTDTMLGKYKRWLPSTWRAVQTIAASWGTARGRRHLKNLYPRLKKTSIDYGIMERDREMLVVPCDFTWSDIGTWAAVYDMLAERHGHNVTRSRHINLDSDGNLLFSYSGKLIATAGLHDMVVIETDDALLICPKERTQDVKKIVAEIERQRLHKHL